MINERRIKQIRALSIFTALLSFVWFLLIWSMGQNELSLWLIGATICFVAVIAILKLQWYMLARVLYLVALNLSIIAASSYVGRPGHVEFVLLFAFGLPFVIFSFVKEKPFILLFAPLPILGWIALFVTDFDLISKNKVELELAEAWFYPLSIISTFVLVGFQILYFAQVSAKYSARVHRQRKEAEEASSAKSRFLSTMSHEIRTPLNAIIGISHILNDNGPRDDQKDNLEALNYSGKILLELLNNVLDYSKMEAQELILDETPININEEFRQVRKIHETNCDKKGITISVDIEENIPTVWLDAVRFNQVLNNLINNAVKFTEEGGVSVSIRAVSSDEKGVRLITQVSDTGIGIAEENLETIFGAFKQELSSTQRVFGGTGLGLSISQKIVEKMGSELKVESKIGSGTTFQFEVKLKRAKNIRTTETTRKSNYDLRGIRVLLVEDNPINELVGKQILGKAGMIVDSAVDGSIAVEKAKANEYDIILMDIQMPIMNGYEASIKIREFNPTIPIVALSASVLMEVKDLIYKSGMNGFILKPFDPENLFETIYKVTVPVNK